MGIYLSVYLSVCVCQSIRGRKGNRPVAWLSPRLAQIMLRLASSRLGGALRPRLVTALLRPQLLRPFEPPRSIGPIAHMSLWQSPTVQSWFNEQAEKRPDDFLPRPWATPGYKRTSMCSPRLSRRRQSLLIKKAIKANEIKLEPTRMPDLHAKVIFKGHMRQRNRPTRQAEIAARMADMPKMIEDYKTERLARRRQARKDAYFKPYK